MRFLFILLFVANISNAQDSVVNDISLQLKSKNGFLAAHRGTMSHLAKERVTGFELSLCKRLNGSNNWHESYRNPIVGATLYGSTLGNNEILGQGFGVYGFIEFPMSRNKKLFLTSHLGAGLGGVTKVFDQEKNPKNIAISSHLNALLSLGINGRWFVRPEHALVLGVDMTHFSNGASKMPNLGLNMLNISLGYAYTVKQQKAEAVAPIKVEKTPFFSNWKYSVLGIVSTKEIFPTTGKSYPVYAISNILHKRFKPKVGMEIALDFISKQSIFGYRTYIPKTQWTVFQVGAYAGYYLPLNRFGFVLGMGVYLKDRYDADDEFYHRVGMRYRFDNGLLINLVLKSHWAKADYVEWGVGYTFNNNKKK